MMFFKAKTKPSPKPEPEGPFLSWVPAEYSVGVPVFDEDHKQLAGLINDIHVALIRDRDRARAGLIMEDLIQEIRAHFYREEQAMEEAGYPDLEVHTLEHQALLKEARELARQLYAGTLSALVFPTFMKNWLMVHTRATDRKYTACLRANRKG